MDVDARSECGPEESAQQEHQGSTGAPPPPPPAQTVSDKVHTLDNDACNIFHSFLSRTRVATLATRTACLIFVFQLQDFRQSVKVGDKVLSKYPGIRQKKYSATVFAVHDDDKVMLNWDDKDPTHSLRNRSDLFPPKVGSSNCVCSV
jgi:hypothetical protein